MVVGILFPLVQFLSLLLFVAVWKTPTKRVKPTFSLTLALGCAPGRGRWSNESFTLMSHGSNLSSWFADYSRAVGAAAVAAAAAGADDDGVLFLMVS